MLTLSVFFENFKLLMPGLMGGTSSFHIRFACYGDQQVVSMGGLDLEA